MHTGAMDRRTKALLMLIVAILAVIAFGTGITLCIDWGGASSPPRDYGQPPSAMALPVARHGAACVMDPHDTRVGTSLGRPGGGVA
jgi:hypothetical protein